MSAIEGTGCIGVGRLVQDGPIVPVEFARPPCGDEDVSIQIHYCGMCHSDVHTVKGQWGPPTVTPLCCPGHEMVGKVLEVGKNVSKFKVGQTVGVGCMVDSCAECKACKMDLEQHCPKCTFTYNSKVPRIESTIGTQGGYTQHITVRQNFVIDIPDSLSMSGAAPLLCAGVTTYAPLKRCGVKEGSKVMVAGLGGLGMMACKIAKAMGAEVTVVSRSKSKQAMAAKLGAGLVAISDKKEVEAHQDKYDVLIDTIPFKHDIGSYLPFLAMRGELVMVGGIPQPMPFVSFQLIRKEIKMSGSLIGGVAITQEMIDFCAKHNITAEHEIINADKIAWAVEEIEQGKTSQRFVIDNSTLKDLKPTNK